MGFHRLRTLARGFHLKQGAPQPGFLSKALSSPATTALPTASSHALRRFRQPDASGAKLPEDDQEVSLVEQPTGTAESIIAKDSVYPTVANRKHRPS